MNQGNKEAKQPYQLLGSQLRKLREHRKESVAEVCGAVEIDIEMLGAYETGSLRPSEDILLLLISHFATKEEMATKLWELAGYAKEEPIQTDDNQFISQPIFDNRIIYSDMLHVMVNNYGVVLNFMQGAGPGSAPQAVAKVGMSKEHAKSIIEVLQKTLAQNDPKLLPKTPNKSHKQRKN